MNTLIFLFALMTTPTDRYICDLWTKAITRAGVIEACGVSLLEGLRVDVYQQSDMEFICAKDAVYINNMDELAVICEMEKPLDQYLLRIIEPGYSTMICFVESANKSNPTAEEITAQCPQAKDYVIDYAGEKTITQENKFSCPARNLQTGFGLYQQSPTAADLKTDKALTWLAGKLIWVGQVKPKCPGSSGLDPYTLAANPCGMGFAKSQVIIWQNQFDAEIYASAVANNVPAKLLKRMMMVESQFWPYYTAPAGEVGVMQVTDNGLDTLLRFDATFDPFYFQRNEQNKFWSRSVTRNTLTCVNCKLDEAIAHIKTNMPTYARLLASFHCRAVTINPSLLTEVNDRAWRQAVVDYNGSAEYLTRIEQ